MEPSSSNTTRSDIYIVKLSTDPRCGGSRTFSTMEEVQRYLRIISQLILVKEDVFFLVLKNGAPVKSGNLRELNWREE